VQHVVRFARQIHGNSIDPGVFDRIEEKLANRLEQQRADVLAVGIREGIPLPSDAERYVPCVSRRVRRFVEKTEHRLAIVLMDTSQPLIESRPFVRREPIQPTKSLVLIDVIGVRVSRPQPRRRHVEHQTQPFFAVPKRRFGTRSLGCRPHAFGRPLNQCDLVVCPGTRRRARSHADRQRQRSRADFREQPASDP